MPVCPRKRKSTELEEITQDELERLLDLDAYINVMIWYRKRKGAQMAARIRAGAAVEAGARRAVVKNRLLEVR